MATSLLPYALPDRIEAGCDEAGRGCLAGPVFAAAVILPPNFFHPLLDDSKKLSLKKRLLLREVIEDLAVAWAVAQIDAPEIDEINILNASIKGMHLAIDELIRKLRASQSVSFDSPDFLLIDGHRFRPYPEIAHSCEIRGDGRFASIAAASVLAKTHRDDYMHDLHKTYPQYGWDRNMGYPTRQHRQSIRLHGITPYHRKSFRLLDGQMEIEFKSGR